MASLGGIDLSALLQGVQQGVGDLLNGFRPETQNPALAGNGERTGPDLFANLKYGEEATAYTPPQSNPFEGVRVGGGDLFGAGFGGGEDLFGDLSYGDPDLFGGFQEAKQRADWGREEKKKQDEAEEAIAAIQGGAIGGNWSGPATSDDNAGLTAQQIDQWIVQTRNNAPIAGMGAYILQAANARGVSVPQMLGIMLKESELGTTAGANKILGGIVAPDDQGLGTDRKFNAYGTWEAAIDAIAANLATPMYRGKSLAEQIGNWYVGPEEYKRNGVNATDKAGNGTVADYLNLVSQVYQGLGVQFNAQQAPTRAAAAPHTGGGAGLASMFGGEMPRISQGFNEHDPRLADVYDFGTEFGMDGDGHTGWDIGVGRGTAFYMPAGLTGTVTIAGGSGFYTTNSGDGPGKGELRILLSNGMELILGHNDRIDVRAGQQVSAGQLLGLTGSSGGDHLHVELRQRDPSQRGGWRIIDPSVLFGGQ